MISIIGAGPIGSYTAWLLAKHDEVDIYEEHNVAGLPLQCAGINTYVLDDMLELPKKVIVNRIKKVRLFAPNDDFVEVHLQKPDVIIDRVKFDQYVLQKAEKAGANLHFSHKFVGFKDNHLHIVSGNQEKKLKTDILIGADGPQSAVAKSAGLFGNRSFWRGFQARVYLENDNTLQFYPSVGTYAWVVPESKSIARIGVAATANEKKIFDGFLKRFSHTGMIDMQAGLIPVYHKVNAQKDNVYLVGDAACQVKATTGGGLIPGLMAAKLLSQSIIEKKSYVKNLKSLNNELSLHKQLRRYLDKMTEKDWNYLIKLVNNDKPKAVLGQYSRDFPSRFLLKFLLSEPKFFYFAKLLFS